ncbi:MAG TPA: DUF1028 domain-containing protein [Thermoanaerobaculia bacterium]|nr:DUF1028 domain-containing protein [Thermoanaerobaculia bacterium]
MPRIFLLLFLLLAATPAQATFSLCAMDPATGEAGVIVTTRVPFVGRAVPWVRAGVGAVATQAWTVVEYGRQGLDLLEQGVAPQEVIERLLVEDKGRERRQIGIIDMKGRTASHTGKENGDWAGSRQGRNYTVQGNILVGREVIDAVADHFESSEGSGMPLAERMILALEAGQARGGDRRWGLFQSAAIRVADPNDPGRGGDHLSVSIDVGEHENPVAELRRIYWTTQRRLGYREFSEVQGRDVVELKRMLHALGYWRKDLADFPKEPIVRGDPALQRTDPERFQKQIDEQRKAFDAYMKEFAPYDAAAMDAVDAFRKDHGLVFEGNPRGLVDEGLVKALREAYHRKRAIP